MRTILSVMAATMLSAAPAVAQTGQPSLPNTYGADPDLVCFVIAAAAADRAAPSARDASSSEAGFYLSRVTARFASGPALADAMSRLRTATTAHARDLAPLQAPCFQRFTAQLTRLNAAMSAAGPAKP